MKRLVGEVFPEGADLVVFSDRDDAFTMCPSDVPDAGSARRRHPAGARPGDCSDTEDIDAEVDGDLVVDITFELVGDHPKVGTSQPS